MHKEEQLLKRDVLGRVHTPARRREELLKEFERSGVAATKFSQMVGVKYQTFASWVQKRRREAATAVRPAKELRLVEVVPGDEAAAELSAPWGLLVQLPGGVRVEINHREQMVLVVALIEALGLKSSGSC